MKSLVEPTAEYMMIEQKHSHSDHFVNGGDSTTTLLPTKAFTPPSPTPQQQSQPVPPPQHHFQKQMKMRNGELSDDETEHSFAGELINVNGGKCQSHFDYSY